MLLLLHVDGNITTLLLYMAKTDDPKHISRKIMAFTSVKGLNIWQNDFQALVQTLFI